MQKTIVVTGGTKGIGRAILVRFAQAGYRLITCARSAEDLTTLNQELGRQFSGVALHTLPADLSQPGDTRRFAEFVRGLGGSLDVLVNNTGAFQPGSLHTEPEGQLRQMIEVNLYSAYDLTRALLPTMLQQRAGHVFTMCSVASIKAYANGGAYSVAKYALYGFTKNLREELKETGVRVTAVLPGATLTASWEGAGFPDERFIRAEDVAEAVFGAHSLSPQAVVEELLIRPQLGDI
ncbi:SDR family oxidoreductase [Hymenobacter busanensis]|uniref:SDR family oxidoreductase n=1 Tax=Hymenobacter busanensis TaxID=2607656 RepID=A0A7L4ZVH1_9BACT|nr:SDR family oxidoreductase [Hymenobacter busanensis]KAA9339415.1 SDR family oxidoreductase [Hymenobacter busanensis]QHJ06825.1 SDR family NAD(P)-dependent oxidoreductase [Hymenobacter busanensis]